MEDFEFELRKELWGPGPWQNEPDFEEFTYRDYICLISRGPVGALNGYVILQGKHPFRLKSKQKLLTVHGGITFAEPGTYELKKIRGYLLGFDCAHLGDLVPTTHAFFSQLERKGDPMALQYKKFREEFEKLLPVKTSDVYRDIEFVRNELKKLVDQMISDIEKKDSYV